MPKAPYAWYDELPPDIQQSLDGRLVDGESAQKVADWLQENGFLTHIQNSSAKKNIDRYRRNRLKPKLMEQVAEANEDVPIQKMSQRLNALEGLSETVQIQKERVTAMIEREAQLPKGMLLGDTKHEIRLLKELLVEQGRLQLETGVMRRAPKTFTGQFTGDDGEVKQFSWTEEQEALFQQLDSLVIDGSAEEVS